MKIGFLGFGEVASTISQALIKNGINVTTSVEGRSIKTQKLAKKTGVNLCHSYKEVAETSDIVISAVTPSSAVKVANEVGKHVKGIYVDINNISPKKAKKALSLIENGNTVDASIIGTIKKGIDANIIVSGPCASEFSKLNNFGMNIDVIGKQIGQASAIKILRSSFTKGITALLFETLYCAYKMDIDEVVLKYIAKTECEGFKDSAISRINSTAVHAKRRYEEMDEVISLISENEDPKMCKATKDVFNKIYNDLGKLEERPQNYTEIFKMVK